MKTLITLAMITLVQVLAYSQSNYTAVISSDVKNIPNMDAATLVDIIRMELESRADIRVMDRYEVLDKVSQNTIDIKTCLSKTCLENAGKQLGVNFMVSATLENLSQRYFYTVRLINVTSGSIEKTIVESFIPESTIIRTMTDIMIRQLYGDVVTAEELKPLTRIDAIESKLSLPDTDYLKANGPRMGAAMFFGTRNGEILGRPEADGGFDIKVPILYQFGYQFEKQYLTSGSFQALVECLVLLTGVEQGFFNPSLTILNGLRSSQNGFEFAFGPSFSLTTVATGYESNGKFITEGIPNNQATTTQFDSRGVVRLNSGFVFAVGKTVRSGNLNIPINLYVNANKKSFNYGVSLGFNSRSFKK